MKYHLQRPKRLNVRFCISVNRGKKYCQSEVQGVLQIGTRKRNSNKNTLAYPSLKDTRDYTPVHCLQFAVLACKVSCCGIQDNKQALVYHHHNFTDINSLKMKCVCFI
jgi:hypothetical protein